MIIDDEYCFFVLFDMNVWIKYDILEVYYDLIYIWIVKYFLGIELKFLLIFLIFIDLIFDLEYINEFYYISLFCMFV